MQRKHLRGCSFMYMPTLYTDLNSPAALAMANDIMLRLTIPGGSV